MAIQRGMSDAASMMEQLQNAPDSEFAAEGQDPVTLVETALARVDSYIADPTMVTPETLAELRGDLEQIASSLGVENEPVGQVGKNSQPLS
jgi:hypothetical protein